MVFRTYSCLVTPSRTWEITWGTWDLTNVGCMQGECPIDNFLQLSLVHVSIVHGTTSLISSVVFPTLMFIPA